MYFKYSLYENEKEILYKKLPVYKTYLVTDRILANQQEESPVLKPSTEATISPMASNYLTEQIRESQ